MFEAKTIHNKLSLTFEYTVEFTRAVLLPSNLTLFNALTRENATYHPKVAVVIDGGLLQGRPGLPHEAADYLSAHGFAPENRNIIVLPGGEAVKNNPGYIEDILNLLNNSRIDRHSFLIAIGGGALLDAAGYAAAIAHRGVRLIRLPTTVLAQNDSGVGVKNSINCFGKKNFLGTFATPYAVINDSDFLEMLSPRDRRSGIAEAIKVALIRDPDFFTWIETNIGALKVGNRRVTEELIYRCAALHTAHICSGGDPFEKGSSRPLDFGHWSAHKLEQLSAYSVTHGEAVAIGIGIDAAYSFLSARLSAADLERILQLLLAIGFRITHQVMETRQMELLQGIEEFREHLGGLLTITLLQGIGNGVEVHEMETAKVGEAIKLVYLVERSILSEL